MARKRACYGKEPGVGSCMYPEELRNFTRIIIFFHFGFFFVVLRRFCFASVCLPLSPLLLLSSRNCSVSLLLFRVFFCFFFFVFFSAAVCFFLSWNFVLIFALFGMLNWSTIVAGGEFQISAGQRSART
jgi:hypothetical protein